LKLKMKIDSDEKVETRHQINPKKGYKPVYKAPSSGIILAVLWQSERLARLSVVLPLHAESFISCSLSKKLPISGLSIKIKTLKIQGYFF